jgi:hypothetical protein
MVILFNVLLTIAVLGVIGMCLFMVASLDNKLGVTVLHKLGVWNGVVLTDYMGDEYYTYKRKGFTTDIAYTHPFARIGRVTLNDDGTTGGESIHIKSWREI